MTFPPRSCRDALSSASRATERFARGLAARVNELVADPARAERLGRAGRQCAIERFDWGAIADETVALYASLLSPRAGGLDFSLHLQ